MGLITRKQLLIVRLMVLSVGLSTFLNSSYITNVQAQRPLSIEGPQLVPQLGPAATNSAAISPDGRYVLTSGLRATWLWDASSTLTIRLFTGTAATFSPDSKYVVTAVSKGTTIWEMETGREIRRFDGAPSSFGPIFSPDGIYILTTRDNEADMWETRSGRMVQQFIGHSAAVNSATFSPDGKYVVTASADKTARLWEAETGLEITRVDSSAALMSAVCSAGGTRVLTTSSDDKTFLLWDTKSKKEIRRFQKDKSDYLGIAPATFSPDGKYVLTASWYTAAVMWETDTGREAGTFAINGPVFSASFSSHGRYVLVAGVDKTSVLFETNTGRVVRRFEGYSIETRSVAFSPNGKYLLTADNDGFGHLWDIGAGREIRRFKGSSSVVYSASFSSDGKRVVMPGNDETAHIFDTETGIEGPKLKHHSAVVRSAVFSRDGKYVLTASADITARLWDANTGREIREFKGQIEDSDLSTDSSAMFSPDEKFVLAEWGWGHKTAQVWETKTGRSVTQFKGHTNYISSAVYSPDGKFVLTASYDKTARLWDATTGRQVQEFSGHPGPVISAVFSRDGKHILTGSGDRTAILFETDTAREVRRFKADSGFALSAMFSPDEKYVLALAGEAGIWMWETNTGFLKGKFEEHPETFGPRDIMTAIAVSPDGKYLMSGQQDGTVRLWSVPDVKQIAQLMAFKDSTWNIVSPDGRFDSSDLEEVKGLRWVMPDQPMTPLPLEIFMRDYYEPRLLRRILKGETLPDVPSLTELNRVQPRIEKIEVRPHSDKANEVDVTVRVASVMGQCFRGGQHVPCESGVYDLRLYRDGQLVKQSPPPANENATSNLSKKWREQLEPWRQSNLVRSQDGQPISASAGPQEITFTNIQLPRRAAVSQVMFTAYAFNEDRVKSAISEPAIYRLPQLRPGSQPKAYVVTVGVDVTSAGWRLRFARTGVTEIEGLLQKTLAPRYQVVSVRLISAYQSNSNELVNAATKRNIQTVLSILSGRDVEKVVREKVQHQEQLQAATPDDLVVLYIASHGYVDPAGKFYVIPSDIGQPLGVSEELLDRCLKNSEQSVKCENGRNLLQRSISSDELTQWIEGVDAGQMVLILDSCHSGAVSGPGFKPGPMGDRSFGQLSYDKGMLVLAATQADQLDTGTLELGNRSLLTYALTQQISGPVIDLRAWLSQAEKMVPDLYQRFVKESDSSLTSNTEADQQPILFDFSTRKEGVR